MKDIKIKDDVIKTEEPEDIEQKEETDKDAEADELDEDALEENDLEDEEIEEIEKKQKEKPEKKEKLELKEELEEENKEEHKKHSRKEHKEAKHKKQPDDEYYSFKANPKKILINLLVLVIAVLLITCFIYFNNKYKENKQARELAEKNRPAQIQLTLISNALCGDCTELDDVILNLKLEYNTTKEDTIDYSTSHAKELINNYEVTKIPVIVIEGELDRITFIEGFESKGQALIFSETEPPYTNAVSGDIIGRIYLTMIEEPSCADCVNLSVGVEEIKKEAKIVSEKTLSSSSDKGKELISKYNIKKLPTIIMSKDIKEYYFSDNLAVIGTYESDGNFILRNVSPPYFDIDKNKVIGLVTLTYLSDKNCTQCYDVKEHREILEVMGIKIVDETIVDINDSAGADLKTKYNITAIPTIIISEGAREYSSFMDIWENIGTKESDGKFIFRDVKIMGTYKDLITNETINEIEATES